MPDVWRAADLVTWMFGAVRCRRPWAPRYPRTVFLQEINVSSDIDAMTYARIEAMIASDGSPVGIDAKKTHVIIIDHLERLQRRLERLERQLAPSRE